MKIEIDTKHDSPEEIRKVIKMLQHLVGENVTINKNIFESSDNTLGISSYDNEEKSSSLQLDSNAPVNAFSAMFGDNSSNSVKDDEEPKTIDLDEESRDKDIPEVIEY